MNNWYTWYNNLTKPNWTPPPSVIGTIWTLLYPIILISFGYAVFLVTKGRTNPWLLVPLVINIMANIAFTPLFMGQRNLALASLDVLILLASIVWIIVAFWPVSKGVVYAQVPYLIWVSIASTAMLSIYFLNK